jgi:hypothetical protein
MSEQTEEATLSTPLGSIATKGKKTSEIIAFLSLALMFLLAYVLWEHKSDTKDSNIAVVVAQKEMTGAMREMVAAQREQTCLSLIPESRRMEEFTSQWSRCKQLARER